MYRLQNQSKVCQSNYHDQIPFFRETIAIIDECTKLMKDDRIYLRNKIKDYLKQLRENKPKQEEWQNEQIQLLIQIFVEANKKKSLNKIQKGDKVMDWLQIKLRKFIDNNKKQRHKKEVESFRKIKGLYPKRTIESPGNLQKSLSRSRQYHHSNAPKLVEQVNKLSFNIEAKKKSSLSKYSLGKSNQKSPNQSRRKVSQNASYSNQSFYKQFDYLRKSSKSKEKEQNRPLNNSSLVRTKFACPQTKPIINQLAKLNKSLDTNKYVQKRQQNKIDSIKFGNKKKEEKLLKNKPLFQQKPIQASLTKHQIDKLTELFSHHLNSQQEKKPQSIPNKQTHQFLFPQKLPKKVKEQLPSQNKIIEGETQRQINNNINRYEYSSNKIDQMLRNSKNILAQFEQKRQQNLAPYKPSQALKQQFDVPKSALNDDLFTPPDFLAECRKFMFSSSKKKSEQDFYPYQQNNNNKPPTFSQILNQSKQRSIQKLFKLNQFGINETSSENISANLSTNKAQSQINFHFKHTGINSIEQLLLQVFKYSNKIVLDRYQLSDIRNKCSPQVQKIFQKYCNVLQLQSNVSRQKLGFDFIATVKYLYTLGEVLQSTKEYFCLFVCQILDIRKKGYVDEQDIQNFIESLQNSQLNAQTLKQIQDILFSIFKRSCEVQGGSIITHWSIYYLELKGDKQVLNLKEHLKNFQFQLQQGEDV